MELPQQTPGAPFCDKRNRQIATHELLFTSERTVFGLIGGCLGLAIMLTNRPAEAHSRFAQRVTKCAGKIRRIIIKKSVNPSLQAVLNKIAKAAWVIAGSTVHKECLQSNKNNIE